MKAFLATTHPLPNLFSPELTTPTLPTLRKGALTRSSSETSVVTGGSTRILSKASSPFSSVSKGIGSSISSMFNDAAPWSVVVRSCFTTSVFAMRSSSNHRSRFADGQRGNNVCKLQFEIAGPEQRHGRLHKVGHEGETELKHAVCAGRQSSFKPVLHSRSPGGNDLIERRRFRRICAFDPHFQWRLQEDGQRYVGNIGVEGVAVGDFDAQRNCRLLVAFEQMIEEVFQLIR